MIRSVLVDTNIVLDLLGKREEFYKDAQQLFSFGELKKVELYVSTLTIANTHYILSRDITSAKAKSILRQLMLIVKLLPMDEDVIGLALESNFKDFEDGIQYYTATKNDIEVIATRNKKDFKQANLPILNAGEIVKLF